VTEQGLNIPEVRAGSPHPRSKRMTELIRINTGLIRIREYESIASEHAQNADETKRLDEQIVDLAHGLFSPGGVAGGSENAAFRQPDSWLSSGLGSRLLWA
jgi:hypothetical protein